MALVEGRSAVLTARRRRRRGESGRAAVLLSQAACFAAVLVVWQGIRSVNLVPVSVLPAPWDVVRALGGLLPEQAFWSSLGLTLRTAVTGLVLAAAAGIPLGLVTGTYAAAERASRLLVDVLRAFPVIALLPVFILIQGATQEMKTTIVFIACVFPVFLQAQYGAMSVTSTIAETVRGFRIPNRLRFAKVVLPSAVPSIMTGLRLAATTSVLVSIGVELLSTVHGLGFDLVQQQQVGNTAVAYAYIVVAGVLGYAINTVSELLERVLLRWRPPSQAE